MERINGLSINLNGLYSTIYSVTQYKDRKVIEIVIKYNLDIIIWLAERSLMACPFFVMHVIGAFLLYVQVLHSYSA